MKAYLITWHESDGNDCTVYDSIIEAESEEKALDTLHDQRNEKLKGRGEYEDDGNHLGFYFNCLEDCPEECEGHGGTVHRETREYQTLEEAESNLASYHVRWQS